MQKLKGFIGANKFYIIALFTITIMGLFLRIIGLNKPDGFWYDEALTFSIAKEAFPFGILNKLYNQDFHAPLYYFFLHFFSDIVHNNEILIRFSSVFFGVLALPVFYFTGKELDSPKAGLYTAMLAAINSCLIYYSQEVRFYSFLIFLCALTILFMVRIYKNGNKYDCLGLALTNLLIIYTYTMGNLYIFFELSMLFVYLFLKNKKPLKALIISHFIVLFLYLPYLKTFLHFVKCSSISLVGNFWWIQFGLTSPLLVIQDWFTPVLLNLRSHPVNFYDPILKNGLNIPFTLFILIPVTIYFIGIIKTLMQRNFASLICLFGIGFLTFEIIMASQGKLGLMTRYTLIILPAIIVSAGYGLAKIQNKFISLFLIFAISGISLFYIFVSPVSAPKMSRDGYLKYISELEKYKPDENDIIVIPYGGRFFSNYYLNHKAFILPFDIEELYTRNSDLEIVFDKDTIKEITNDTYKNKVLLMSYIANFEPSPEITKYVKDNIINRLNKNGRVFIIISGGIKPFEPSILKSIAENNNYYLNIPIFTMISSKTINDLLILNDENLQFVSKNDYKAWQMYIFKKP